MKNKTLLVLAAGMGSRFGGLKQTEKFGPNGEFIIDYSVFDAIKSGFNKVIFVIKEENYDLFRETIGSRVESHIKVEYAFQDMSDVPSNYKIPQQRVKPLGTAHALLAAKKYINEPFVIINSDDFYGYEAFEVASKYIDKNTNEIAIVGYKIKNTLTENGSVKRGVLQIKNNKLEKIIESKIEEIDGKLICEPLSNDKKFEVDEDTLVSMNMIVFPKEFINYIKKEFDNFLKNADLLNDEYLIPDVLSKAVENNDYNVIIEKTNSKWVGVTYKEDTKEVKDYLNKLIKENKYKANLWE